MKILMLSLVLAAGLGLRGSELPAGWNPKFYLGTEASGTVSTVPGACKGSDSMRCAWESGATKFGVETEVMTEHSGWIDWTVEAMVKSEGDYGYAGAAMSFLDAAGRPVGSVSAPKPIVAKEWKKTIWKFSSPKTAKRFFVQLLSLDRDPVQFAKVKITSRPGIDRGDIPFEVLALPAEKNSWWSDDRVRTLNFSDAPIATLFYMKGAKEGRDSLRFVIDIPAALEIRDIFCPNGSFYETIRPLATEALRTNDTDYVRYSFGDLRFFKEKSFGSLNPARYFNDEGTALALVIAPKDVHVKPDRAFPIYYRMTQGGKRGQEKSLYMEFCPLPANLRISKGFSVYSWNNVDRHFASDAAFNAAARAYEAAGFRSFNRESHGGKAFTRRSELIALSEKRPVPYIYAIRIPDVWSPKRLFARDDKPVGEFDIKMCICSDPRYQHFARGMCPEYFTRDAKLQAYLRKYLHQYLEDSDARDGDWVFFDMEPWHSYAYCHCETCHRAFAKFAGLDHVPTAAETQNAQLRDQWALFRCSHNAKSIEQMVRYIHEYNPNLKCIDYDYVMPYGDEQGMMARRRSVGKDTLVNDRWLDGHLCSYYHKIDLESFKAIRNDTRHLKKMYVPIGANDGAGGYLQPNEVLSPAQYRQFAYAAFVHGCPGIAFYSGNAYDGRILLALMAAQNDIARWEHLPWGKVEGKSKPTSPSGKFAFASTVKPEGGEVLALFNYDPEDPIKVEVAGATYELKPYETRFVEIQ